MNGKIILTGLQWIGIKEFPGISHSPTVLSWLQAMDQSITTDETSWCSAYAAHVARTAGYEFSKSLSARSWLQVGQPVNDPEPGDVVVFWRNSLNSWQGHVGFYIRENTGSIFVLGGNQSNMVSIAPYPKSRLLGYRRLRELLII